uniref:Uncharacterized protein n=1 Tax=Amphiprion ocellaris TaxID=80972 RepID=A0AAQ5YHW8_AMPOC
HDDEFIRSTHQLVPCNHFMYSAERRHFIPVIVIQRLLLEPGINQHGFIVFSKYHGSTSSLITEYIKYKQERLNDLLFFWCCSSLCS